MTDIATDPRCGTYAGHQTHIRQRTTPCPACCEARRRYIRDYRLRRPDATRRSHLTHRSKGITARQLQILTLAAEGLSNGQIGVKIFLSVDMVKTELHVLRHHLEARNTAHAVAIALRKGLIP